MRRAVTVFFGMLCLFLFLHAVDADAQDTAVGSRPSAVGHSFVMSFEPSAMIQDLLLSTPGS